MAPAAHRIVVPLPFALASANAWLFPGQHPLLVDCGIRTPEAYQVLRAGLAGRDGDAANGGLRLLVTHGHVDHAGNAARLARDAGVPLCAPRAESPYLETFRLDGARRNDEFGAALSAHGVPADVVAAVRRRSDAMDAYGEDTAIAVDVHDGMRIAVGAGEGVVRAAPGHTPGSLLLEVDDQLVTGDTLLEHITSNAIELRDADHGRYRTYLRTLDGLRRYVGMTALPGHHEAFRLTDEVLDTHLAKHARRRAKVKAALDAPRTAWELLPRVLPHLASDQVFLGMCEVVGHLHALELDGEVRVAPGADGTRRFVA